MSNVHCTYKLLHVVRLQLSMCLSIMVSGNEFDPKTQVAVHVPFFMDRLGTTKIRTAEGSLNGWRNCDVIHVHAAILDYSVAMN